MENWNVEVFFDGACPLCVREIDMLRRLDSKNLIRFSDISVPGFEPGKLGRSYEDLMARIHGRLPDGTWIEGVEVFRQLYSAVGFRWIVALTRIPGVSHLLNVAYRVFAKNRLRWTGRCESGVCEVPARATAERA